MSLHPAGDAPGSVSQPPPVYPPCAPSCENQCTDSCPDYCCAIGHQAPGIPEGPKLAPTPLPPPPTAPPPPPPPPAVQVPPTPEFCPGVCVESCESHCPAHCCSPTVTGGSPYCPRICTTVCVGSCPRKCCYSALPTLSQVVSYTVKIPCPLTCLETCHSRCPQQCCKKSQSPALAVVSKPSRERYASNFMDHYHPQYTALSVRSKFPCPKDCRLYCSAKCPQVCCGKDSAPSAASKRSFKRPLRSK